MQAELGSEGLWQINMAVGCFYKHNAVKICVNSIELCSKWQVACKLSFPPFTFFWLLWGKGGWGMDEMQPSNPLVKN